jgi:hypothetical protein
MTGSLDLGLYVFGRNNKSSVKEQEVVVQDIPRLKRALTKGGE